MVSNAQYSIKYFCLAFDFVLENSPLYETYSISCKPLKNYWKTKIAGNGIRDKHPAVLVLDWLLAALNHSQLSFVDI